jgi:inner membrane protein
MSHQLVKLSILFGLLILSSIPSLFVEGIITGRENYGREATASVVSNWAARHEIGSVTLAIPVHKITPPKKKGESSERIEITKTFTPSRLAIRSNDQIEIRKRGIFKIPIYKSDLEMEGSFVLPSDLDPQIEAEIPTPKVQSLSFAFGHPNAISDFELEIDGKPASVERQTGGLIFRSVGEVWQPGQTVRFKLKARLNGYEGIDIKSAARTLDVSMQSPWPHPSFEGQLPIDQKIDEKGFAAHWKIVEAQEEQVMTVNYIEPINIYSQTSRALKYGLLITLICLSVLFTMEVVSGLKIHGMQYLLMTLPLSTFYILLLAAAEHIGFAAAYGVASFAVVALIYFYFAGAGATRKQSKILAGVLAGVYGLILSMLSSEDYALLIGAIFLFTCLATFMLMTRKIDWGKRPSAA